MTKRVPRPNHRLSKLRRSAGFDTRMVWAPPCWVEEHEPIFHYIPDKNNKRDDEWRIQESWEDHTYTDDGIFVPIPRSGFKLKTPCGIVIQRGYHVKMKGVEFPLGHALQIGRLCKKCFPGGIEAERSWPTKDEIAKTTERLIELQRQLKGQADADG